MLRGALQTLGWIRRLPGEQATLRAFFLAGYHWITLPAGDEVFGLQGPNLAHWLTHEAVQTIKSGQQRTVYRVVLPDGAIIVKQCRVNGLRAWWREMFRGSKSQLEFENALALRQLGLAAIEPLAWGRSHPFLPSESLFVSRCEEQTVPLQSYLEKQVDFSWRETATALGQMLAQMHDHGVAHPDPHPGNLLVQFDGNHPRFLLIDLHAIHFGEPLAWQESLDNLVLMNRWFQLRATRTDRRAFWRAYIRARTTLPITCPVALAEMARQVERRTQESNARFWNSRLERYQKNNRQYQRLRSRHSFGHAVSDLPPAFVSQMLANPDSFFTDPTVKILKHSRSSTVIEIAIPSVDGPRVGILKRFSIKSRFMLLKNRLRRTAAMRSWTYGQNLLDRGLPTARPLLVLHRTRLGCPAEGYLLTEKVANASDLVESLHLVLRRPRAEQMTIIRQWADSLGRLIRLMHEKRVSHRDLKAPNILMSRPADGSLSQAAPTLIDLVGVVPGSPVSRGTRTQNLARFNASFVHQPAITRTDRLRFLRAYLAWGLHGSDGWKDWWREVARETRLKVEKNRRSGRPLA